MEKYKKINKQPDFGNEAQDNAFSLWDALDFLKQGWRWIAGGVILGLTGAMTSLLISPVRYEAIAVIQPAMVGVSATAMRGSDVESLELTMERLKKVSFYTPEMVESCRAYSAPSLASAVKSSVVKGTTLIQLRYQAASKAEAVDCLNAVIAQLAKAQSQIAAPIIKLLEEQLVQSRLRLNEQKELQAQLEKRSKASDEASLLMLYTLLKRGEVESLRKQTFDLETQLSATLTQPLRFFEPTYVPEKAVFPNQLRVLAVGLFGGLLLGGFVYFVCRRLYSRYE